MWISTGLTLIVAGLALAMARSVGKTEPDKRPALCPGQNVGRLNICRNHKRVHSPGTQETTQ
jgi:hypothetical protein